MRTRFLGKDLQSPVIIGSGPLSYGSKGIVELNKNGAGAIVTKTIRLEEAINPTPHMVLNSKNGLINNELWSDYSYKRWVNIELPNLKKNDAVVIASLGHTVEETSQMIEGIVNAGADIIELVSYSTKDLTPMLVDAKKKTDVPIIVKLPSKVQNLPELIKQLEKNGADAFTICDSVGPAVRFDIDNMKPVLGGSHFGWITGQGILPITLYNIVQARMVTDLPIIALGGIMNYEDAIECCLAGANLIGVCTLPIIKGPKVIPKLINDIDKWLRNKNIDGIENIPKANFSDQIEWKNFTFIEEKCVHCKACERVCCYDARFINDHMKFFRNRCRYCGLCSSVCPTNALLQHE